MWAWLGPVNAPAKKKTLDGSPQPQQAMVEGKKWPSQQPGNVLSRLKAYYNYYVGVGLIIFAFYILSLFQTFWCWFYLEEILKTWQFIPVWAKCFQDLMLPLTFNFRCMSEFSVVVFSLLGCAMFYEPSRYYPLFFSYLWPSLFFLFPLFGSRAFQGSTQATNNMGELREMRQRQINTCVNLQLFSFHVLISFVWVSKPLKRAQSHPARRTRTSTERATARKICFDPTAITLSKITWSSSGNSRSEISSPRLLRAE